MTKIYSDPADFSGEALSGFAGASPSAQQIVSVALAADAGGGIFLSYVNYVGAVLNFNAAPRRRSWRRSRTAAPTIATSSKTWCGSATARFSTCTG